MLTDCLLDSHEQVIFLLDLNVLEQLEWARLSAL